MTSSQTTFDPTRERERLVTRLSQLDPGIIRTAAPLGGCEIRAWYVADVLAHVHAHLIAMTDDMRGNLNLNVDTIERLLDGLHDIGDDVLTLITTRVEIEREDQVRPHEHHRPDPRD